jgi:uncharacterized membrane protein
MIAREFSVNRVEAFSDGVLAIVITLLVLEIKVPQIQSPLSIAEAWRSILVLLPKFASFFLSFLFIAVFWINHHRFFSLIRKVDWGLLWLNTLLLLFLCFVPFPTAFIGDYPRNPIALALFAIVLMLSGIAFNLMWRYSLAKGLTEESGVRIRILAAIRRGSFGPLAYALSGGAAFVFLPLSWLIFLLVPIFYALPVRAEKLIKED